MATRDVLDQLRSWTRMQETADYFREQSFLKLVVLVGAAAWLWVGYELETRRLDPTSGTLLVGLVIGAGWLISQTAQTRYLAAIFTFIGAQILFVSSMIWVTGQMAAGHLFILVIVMAGALVGPAAMDIQKLEIYARRSSRTGSCCLRVS